MAVGTVSVPSKTWVPPVGMILTTGSPTSPAALYDGTSWARITDRFLIGAGGNYSLGSTGGSTSHTLTVAEMPAHSHSGSISAVGNHQHAMNFCVERRMPGTKQKRSGSLRKRWLPVPAATTAAPTAEPASTRMIWQTSCKR